MFLSQLDNYLSEPRVPRSTNIYGYWSNSQYPRLEPAARKYLSAPPTSVASEQLFSAAGQIYSDRRSNLLGENAEKLLFLTYNIRLFNFDYWSYVHTSYYSNTILCIFNAYWVFFSFSFSAENKKPRFGRSLVRVDIGGRKLYQSKSRPPFLFDFYTHYRPILHPLATIQNATDRPSDGKGPPML